MRSAKELEDDGWAEERATRAHLTHKHRQRTDFRFADAGADAPSARCRHINAKGERCGHWTVRGEKTCSYHGGRGGGRPIVHGLNSKKIPAEWREEFEEYLAEEDYTSLRKEIAFAQINLQRFLDILEGGVLTEQRRQELGAHLEAISRLKEREARRLYNEKILNELIAQQVEAEARILGEILTRYVSQPKDAERAAGEFAAALRAEIKVSRAMRSLPAPRDR